MAELKSLSNHDLHTSFVGAAASERKITYDVLLHVKEVERRKLYLEKGYPTLKKYMVEELKYSGSSADRRIEAAKLLRDVPEVAGKIQDGDINLSQIVELSRAIHEKRKTGEGLVSSETKLDLVDKIVGKTTFETQTILAQELSIPVKDREFQKAQGDGSVRVEITFTKEQYEHLMSCRDKNAHHFQSQNFKSSLAELIDLLALKDLKSVEKVKSDMKPDLATVRSNKKNSPAREFKSELSSEIQNNSILDGEGLKNQSSCDTASVLQSETDEGCGDLLDSCSEDEFDILTGERDREDAPVFTLKEIRIRYESRKSVTPKMRREVLERDQCCQYVDKLSGKKCGSRFALEVDHIDPKWNHGLNHPSNLQALCAGHNKFRYMKQNNQTRV